ncbi:MAG TPA: alpha-L-arabinofuranosidase [Chloroflexus aurantiacus]|uniref:Alpha-L-arabinofuranosidase-like protein n=1 Tax=Chloroflexus aurantiacus (strain ATCC 29366 / DSM 635 / J-10-fl) TaxID=324602 RepID=A9WAE5_CHLAA|nr:MULTISPECIES: alpha-L-arabinofuranosidase [Chloroflexus]ABY34704.1 Alpha-L-arabinofuranosidase-like protein [Chloroflexus aurantiacus J-10-fl]RMG46976.1 MAG: alpha-L-arabinofuranosidase [Chloroflexota bacterium]HBW67336.1 alpha-L-arabinofuranosidase [Chloroflexus aurantiacus]
MTFLCRFYTMILVFILAGCNAPVATPGSTTTPVAAPTAVLPTTAAPTLPAATSISNVPTIVIDPTTAQPFDRRLLGTNVPAWLSPYRLNDETFIQRTADLGLSLLRMPGGSWSNGYAWAACETGGEECYWPWAAKPSDFLRFARAVNADIIWTVSINGSAQEAAALVAFFNGTVDDQRPIGVDARGRDWQTVGYWARLRAETGSTDPFPVRYWEVGNEVYGAKGEVGPNCSEWGWEDVWTCDPDEYLRGKTVNGIAYDGYLAFYDAMKAVDPTIQIGAVGVEKPDEWSDWGNRVIAGAGDKLDFYVVHYYPYFQPPENPRGALQQPQRSWSTIMTELNNAFERHLGRRVPVAVTEYNLIAFQDLDNAQLMRRGVNLLFIADTIGQMATHGVVIANQWDLANGRAANDTDYGLLHADTFEPHPQYYALLIWRDFGDEMLSVQTTFDPATTLSVYAGRHADGTLTLLAINKTDQPLVAAIGLPEAEWQVKATTVSASDLLAETVSVNRDEAPTAHTPDRVYTFAPYAVTFLTFTSP